MSEPTVPQNCEGCGVLTAECVKIRTTNGVLNLCETCLADVNRKNPALVAAEAENARLREELSALLPELSAEEKAAVDSIPADCCQQWADGNKWDGERWVPSDGKIIEQLTAENTRLAAEAAAKDATIAGMRSVLEFAKTDQMVVEWIGEEIDDALASNPGSALLAERDALLAEAAALREALTMHERIDDLSKQIARDDADLDAGSDGSFTDEEKGAMVDELAAIHKRCLAALASSGVPDSVKGHP